MDTNVLLRYLTDDDPQQAATVVAILEDCLRNGEPVFLSVVVLCELVRVLDRAFGQTKTQICADLDLIFELELFRVERESLVRQSLDRHRNGRGDFADYLIGAIGAEAGCRDTVTFDRALRGAADFLILVGRPRKARRRERYTAQAGEAPLEARWRRWTRLTKSSGATTSSVICSGLRSARRGTAHPEPRSESRANVE